MYHHSTKFSTLWDLFSCIKYGFFNNKYWVKWFFFHSMEYYVPKTWVFRFGSEICRFLKASQTTQINKSQCVFLSIINLYWEKPTFVLKTSHPWKHVIQIFMLFFFPDLFSSFIFSFFLIDSFWVARRLIFVLLTDWLVGTYMNFQC